jgi:hypothetical protein
VSYACWSNPVNGLERREIAAKRRKKHKKEDEEKLTQSRKGAKVKTKTNR